MEDDTETQYGTDQSAGFAVGPKADQFADWEAQKADLARRATAQRLQQFNDAKGYIERAYRGPSTSEQLMAISQALLAPRRYRGFAGTMSKLSTGFGGIQEAQRKAEQQRAQALMQLQQQYQTRELDAEDKGLDTQLAVLKARAAANKGVRLAFDSLGRARHPYTGAIIREAPAAAVMELRAAPDREAAMKEFDATFGDGAALLYLEGE